MSTKSRIKHLLVTGSLCTLILAACEKTPSAAPVSSLVYGPQTPLHAPIERPALGGATFGPNGPPVPATARTQRAFLRRTWSFYFGLDENVSIGFAQVHQESRWNCAAVSSHGAMGCAQFMPATAVWIAPLLPKDIRDACAESKGCPFDPKWALTAMSKFDRALWQDDAFAATEDDRWRFVLSSYNGGGGWVRRERAEAKKQGLDDTRWASLANVCLRSVASCRENRGYPAVILDKYRPLYRAWLGG